MILLLTAVVLIAYFRALKATYIIDDIENYNAKCIPKNPFQKLWWRLIGCKYSNPQVEHLIGLSVHLLNTMLIYLVFGKNLPSFMAALLFAVHPAATQGSIWLSGKGYAISTLFILLMFHFKIWGIIFYAVAVFFSTNAVLAPLLFINSWWALALIPLAYIPLRRNWRTLKSRFGFRTGVEKRLTPGKLVIAMKSLGYYTCLALIPTRLGVYHDFLYTYNLSEEDIKKGYRIDRFFCVGVGLLIVIATGYLLKWPVFGLVWFLLFIAQWCNLITIQQAVAERYVYLPLAGMMLFVGEMICKLPYELRYPVFCMVFMYYLARLQFHIASYYSLLNCIDYNIINFPELHVCWTWKGQTLKNLGSFFSALESWFQGWRLRPNDFRLNNNIAVMLTDMGFIDDAERFLDNAEHCIIPEQEKPAREFIDNARKRIAFIRSQGGQRPKLNIGGAGDKKNSK